MIFLPSLLLGNPTGRSAPGPHLAPCEVTPTEDARGPRLRPAQTPRQTLGARARLRSRPGAPVRPRERAGRGRARSPAAPRGAARGRPLRSPQGPSLRAWLLALGARACAQPPRRCLAVSMATKSVDLGSAQEKMKLKSLLLRYYPPGSGRPPSFPAWGPRLWPWEGLGRRRLRGPEGPAGSPSG